MRKFKNKLKRLSADDLTRTLIKLNADYYTALHHITENPSPPQPEKDREYLKLLEEKITLTTKRIEEKINKSHCPNCCQHE